MFIQIGEKITGRYWGVYIKWGILILKMLIIVDKIPSLIARKHFIFQVYFRYK